MIGAGPPPPLTRVPPSHACYGIHRSQSREESPQELAAHVRRHPGDKFEAHAMPLLAGPGKQNMEVRLHFPAISLPARFGSLRAGTKFPAGRARIGFLSN